MRARGFRQIWIIDFEFESPDGEIPAPICFVARELRTGNTIRMWRDALLAMRQAPIPGDSETLIVAYYASAEMLCYRALGWDLPTNVLDLFPEFRRLTNA
jgi:DNA polymerase-1